MEKGKLIYDRVYKSLLLLIVFISIFNRPLSHLMGINLSYLDEVLLLFSVGLFSLYILLARKVKMVYLLVVLFFFYSICISVLFGLNQNLIDIIFQTLVTLKFSIITLAFFLLFKNDQLLVRRFYWTLLGILLLGVLLNIVFATDFNHFIGLKVSSRPFTKIIRYGGWINPNQLAYFMVLSIGLVLNRTYMAQRMLNKRDWTILIGLMFIILLTDSRSAFLGVFLFFLFFYKNLVLRKAKILLTVLSLSFVCIGIIVIYTDFLDTMIRNLNDSFSLESFYIRGIIINMAIQISYGYFPIGTGAATFGSVFSKGSQVYEDFGVADRYFFTEMAGIYDSSLASVLGEYGILGLLLFGLIFYYFKRFLHDNNKTNKPVMTSAFLVVFLFFSFTNPTFTNNIYIFLSLPFIMGYKFIFKEDKSLQFHKKD